VFKSIKPIFLFSLLGKSYQLDEDTFDEDIFGLSSSSVDLDNTSQILPLLASTSDPFSDEEQMKARLSANNLMMRSNLGNGDCLPYSVIDYLAKLNDYKGDCKSLRIEVAKYVLKNWRDLIAQYPNSSMVVFAEEDQVIEWALKIRNPQEWCEIEFAEVAACIFR